MLPAFEVEDYDRGVLSGVEDVILIVSNPEYAEEMLDDSRREQDGWDDFFVPALISGSVIILIWFGILTLRQPVLIHWQWLPLITGFMGFIGFFLFRGEEITTTFLFFRTLFALGLIGLGVTLWLEKPVQPDLVP